MVIFIPGCRTWGFTEESALLTSIQRHIGHIGNSIKTVPGLIRVGESWNEKRLAGNNSVFIQPYFSVFG